MNSSLPPPPSGRRGRPPHPRPLPHPPAAAEPAGCRSKQGITVVYPTLKRAPALGHSSAFPTPKNSLMLIPRFT